MQDKIISFLKGKQDYVSGEEMASALRVSRQALWKHVQDLRDAGYNITAVPHLGYKLLSSPDRLFPSEILSRLKTKTIGRKIYYFDNIDSTMDAAMQLAVKNAPEGTIILAEGQVKGRGRLGRSWVSPKHKGIYISLILRPQASLDKVPLITLLSAVSVCEAVAELSGLEPQIKWPNDIMLHNKKLGGILTELKADMDRAVFVIVGIGLNVNNDSRHLLPHATSLAEQKKHDIDRLALLAELLLRIEENYKLLQSNDFQAIADKWRNLSLTLNRRVKIHSQSTHIEGEAVDIDMDGALLVRNDSGLVQRVTAGDIIHCR